MNNRDLNDFLYLSRYLFYYLNNLSNDFLNLSNSILIHNFFSDNLSFFNFCLNVDNLYYFFNYLRNLYNSLNCLDDWNWFLYNSLNYFMLHLYMIYYFSCIQIFYHWNQFFHNLLNFDYLWNFNNFLNYFLYNDWNFNDFLDYFLNRNNFFLN